ncbi:MAG: ATP-dependent DNA helicase, partial [bacterium]
VPCNKTSPDKKQEHRNIIPYNRDKNGYTDKCEAGFFDLSHIREVAEAAKVCPFELALELSSWCDAILCDYNYAFDPHAYLRRFFGENADGGSVLLVDEAHNLVERGRSMYSAMLSKANVLAAKKVLKTARPKAARALEKLNKSLLALQKTLPEENAENVRNNQKCRILSPAWLSGEGEADGKFEHGTVFDTEETIGRKEAALKTVSLRTLSFLTGGAEKRVLSEEKVSYKDNVAFKKKEFYESKDSQTERSLVANLTKDSLGRKMVDAVPSGREQLQTVYTNALRAVAELDAFFKEERGSHLREEVLDFYFELRTFVDTFEAMQEGYIAYGAMDEDKHFFFELFCADPSRRLTEMAERAGAAIFFSATLLPIDYYRRLLTTHENVPAIYAKSAFDEKNRLVLIGRGVTTRYKDRGIAMYRKIAGYIRALARGKVGNYLAFFPSYQLLYEVLKVYREEFDEQGINFVAQGRGMDELGREIFMENFYEDPRESLVGFCVMGGMFAEGIDLTGTRLIGAVIVGTGLPQVGFQTELLRRYFAELSLDGFQTAYQIPGMSKVLQAGGRVIRTATDR